MQNSAKMGQENHIQCNGGGVNENYKRIQSKYVCEDWRSTT